MRPWREGLPASSARPRLLLGPCPSPGACCIVSQPRGKDCRWSEGCLFCFGAGGVFEPRTYLSNEVVITPGLTNGMKPAAPLKPLDGPACARRMALQRAGCRRWEGCGCWAGEGAEAVLPGARHGPRSRIRRDSWRTTGALSFLQTQHSSQLPGLVGDRDS